MVPHCNLGKVTQDISFEAVLSVAVTGSLHGVPCHDYTDRHLTLTWCILCHTRAFPNSHFLHGNETCGNSLCCFGSVPGIECMSQPGAVQTFSLWFRTESGFSVRISDTLSSSFFFTFGLWVALWSALLCLPEPTFLRKVIQETASNFCKIILIN